MTMTRKPSELENSLQHTFADVALLDAALTHPSLRDSKRGVAEYERLEFLGDRVLGLIMAERLYRQLPLSTEGDLSKRHAALVNRDALRGIALAMGLDRYLRLAKGESVMADRRNLAVLSDAVEAIIGALYIDGGLEVARRFINSRWKDIGDARPAPKESKTELQEWAQGKGLPLPVYRVIERSGPAHAPEFMVELSVMGQKDVISRGASRRAAEKSAAFAMLEQIGNKR